jgi:hypothetical protein
MSVEENVNVMGTLVPVEEKLMVAWCQATGMYPDMEPHDVGELKAGDTVIAR